MTKFKVVRLSKKDAHLAHRLTSEISGEPAAPMARLAELLEDERNIVLATTRDDSPVGYLVAHQFPSLSGEKLVYLYDIEVSPACRRHGLGTALVSKLKEVCREQGVDSIWVGSSLTNVPALALWTSTGAEQDSEQYVEFNYEL